MAHAHESFSLHSETRLIQTNLECICTSGRFQSWQKAKLPLPLLCLMLNSSTLTRAAIIVTTMAAIIVPVMIAVPYPRGERYLLLTQST